jgi:hypothetical protein
MAEGKAVAARAAQVAGVGGFEADSAEAARDEAAARRAAERAARGGAPSAAEPARSTRPKFPAALVALGALAALCGLVAFFVLAKKDAAVQLSSHHWERVIAVEQLQTVTDTAWRNQVPNDARSLSCHEAQRSTKQVPDGERCTTVRSDNGDGTFSESERCSPKYRDEPVYDTRCTFTVDRWRQSRAVRADGTGVSPAPEWPTVVVSGGSTVGSEREASRKAAYTLEFLDPDHRALRCTVDQARWTAMADGSRWTAPVGRFVDSIDCADLRPL